ncbi:MAG: phage tail assembly protein [Deltaproteobacteria bacterium]|jgi:hypothetical protein|nr:phage tail assembly protein [Deltaproteobacteria bacterium]
MEIPFVFVLDKPIVIDGAESVTNLRFNREPTVKDLYGIDMKAFNLRDYIGLAGRLSNQPTPILDLMSIPDGMRLMRLLGDFLSDGQETGDS